MGLGGLGPFGGSGLGPFRDGGFGGVGRFSGARPFEGGGWDFPIDDTYPGLNVTLPTINGSFPQFPFLGFPSLGESTAPTTSWWSRLFWACFSPIVNSCEALGKAD